MNNRTNAEDADGTKTTGGTGNDGVFDDPALGQPIEISGSSNQYETDSQNDWTKVEKGKKKKRHNNFKSGKKKKKPRSEKIPYI
ncbi:hypothetical protein FRX31_005868 [Thalictrum thalictroides]|uniref:Uncharacterized protein n=1 Tax=Thalictrum thalictroides TaxID=46969 RepID=A0A7J6X439_THATH|nr:hypothetical protein FRX31_005868 [Thalictrum thalictroides]